MELKRDKTEVIAKFIDEKGSIYKIGLGANSFEKSDNKLKIIAQQKYDEIKFREANPSPPSCQELRKKEYFEQGITTEALIIASWEDVVEKRPEARIALQTKREAIKLKYPKN